MGKQLMEFTQEFIFYNSNDDAYTYPENVYVSKNYPYTSIGKFSNLQISNSCNLPKNYPHSHNPIFLFENNYLLFIAILLT